MGWWIALGAVAVLAVLPLGANVFYGADGLRVQLIAGPVRLTLFPRKKKKPEERKAQKPTRKPVKATQEKQTGPNKNGGSLSDLFPLIQLALDFLGELRKKLRVNRLELRLIMAGGDPSDLAVNYGRAWAAVGNLMPQLERLFVIKKRDIAVECDFIADNTSIFLCLDITITLGRLLALAAVYGVRALREFIKINTKKGGVKQ